MRTAMLTIALLSMAPWLAIQGQTPAPSVTVVPTPAAPVPAPAAPTLTGEDRAHLQTLRVSQQLATTVCNGLPEVQSYQKFQRELAAAFEKTYPGYTLDALRFQLVAKGSK